MNVTLLWITAIFLGMTLISTACQAHQDSREKWERDLQVLKNRLEEVEKANQRLILRVEVLENALQLANDRIEALNWQWHHPNPAPVRTSISEQDSSETVKTSKSNQSPEEDEIVVTDEQLQKYIRSHPQREDPVYVPKPPVVQGERLPVHKDKDQLQKYQLGLEYYRSGQYHKAIEVLEAFLNENPPEDYIDNALYWIGDSHYGLGEFALAAKFFHSIIENLPDSNKVPDALLKVGLTYQRLGKMSSAKDVWFYLIQAYPKSKAAAIAQKRLGELP